MKIKSTKKQKRVPPSSPQKSSLSCHYVSILQYTPFRHTSRIVLWSIPLSFVSQVSVDLIYSDKKWLIASNLIKRSSVIPAFRLEVTQNIEKADGNTLAEGPPTGTNLEVDILSVHRRSKLLGLKNFPFLFFFDKNELRKIAKFELVNLEC
jgi:hypothetical protein